jgi:hypothetical protein
VQQLSTEAVPDAPHPASPARPKADHAAYIRADGRLCCDVHEAAFERSVRARRGPLMITWDEWRHATAVSPRRPADDGADLSPEARRYIYQRLSDRRA